MRANAPSASDSTLVLLVVGQSRGSPPAPVVPIGAVVPVLAPGASVVPAPLDLWGPFAGDRLLVDPQLVDALAERVRLLSGPPAVSDSVAAAVRRLGQPIVEPSSIVWELCQLHPEYGGGRARAVRPTESSGAWQFPPQTWLRIVRTLYSERELELHGRTVLFGLALLDVAIRNQLESQVGLFSAVAAELPLTDILSARGKSLYAPYDPKTQKTARGSPPPPTPRRAVSSDTVLHTDNPAVVDALNRKGFARVLARRIRDMRVMETDAVRTLPNPDFPRGRAFLVHLNGRWGAGKTSLLNFLGEELERGNRVAPFKESDAAVEPWLIVNFNAWQHQRIVPPWWWLMSNVYRQGLRHLWHFDKPRAIWFWLREWLWRARAGWAWYLLAALGAVAIGILWRYNGFDAFKQKDVLPLASGAASLTVLVFGVIRGVARSMLSSSTRGAREYIQNTRDPMQTAKAHFADLVERLHYPVAVFIDDLDRCQGKYVVQLLEGIQTLFRDVPVVYVVAADRDWLSDSYAVEYRTFVSLNDEPGRPLGYLFLEKTFQLSAAVDDLDSSHLPSFWKGLVAGNGAAALDPQYEKVLDDERGAALAATKDLPVDEAHNMALDMMRDPDAEPARKQAAVETIAIIHASREAQADQENVLLPFADLLERNPRALKRLVNAFGIARDLERLKQENMEEDLVREHRTALWTILNLRWPQLGEYLAKNPDDVELIEQKTPPKRAPKSLKPLFLDDEVLRVVKGRADGVEAELDKSVLAELVGRSPAPAAPLAPPAPPAP